MYVRYDIVNRLEDYSIIFIYHKEPAWFSWGFNLRGECERVLSVTLFNSICTPLAFNPPNSNIHTNSSLALSFIAADIQQNKITLREY